MKQYTHLPDVIYVVADEETGNPRTGATKAHLRTFTRREAAEKSIQNLEGRGHRNLAIFEFSPWEYE